MNFNIFLIFLCIIVSTSPQLVSNPQIYIKTLFDKLNVKVFNHSYPDTNQFYPEYDFVVIGAGSSGSVMASRLSEINDWTVLLLEVGQEENVITDVPLMASLLGITGYNWAYLVDPTPTVCQAAINSQCQWLKGRALGGSSVINYLVYGRGNKIDYDDWAALGNEGWSYDDVLPYFKKSENINVPDLMNSSFHGRGGYLDVERSSYVSELYAPFAESLQNMGYQHKDPHGEGQLGVSRVSATIRKGRRCSAAKAFLRPARNRPNLHISKRSWATKILFDPQQKNKVVGVEFLKNNKNYVVRVKKEVILSAGTIASAQLLMLSGIGPQDHLESLNIPVVKNLSVGYNLQDHPAASGLVFTVEKPVTIRDTDLFSPSILLDYFLNSRGPLTLPGGAEGLAYVKTNFSFQPADYPDVEMVIGVGAMASNTAGTTSMFTGYPDEFFKENYGALAGKHAFQMTTFLMRPKSRGRIYLRSTNPFEWPHLQPNYFSNPDDMRVLVEGAQLTVKVIESKSFKKLGAKFYAKPLTRCAHLQFRSDEYFECTINSFGLSSQHQVGTCKMGPSSDPNAVVNPELQVHGIENLRVIDASIIPLIPAAHINAVAIMIGEKGADMVKRRWNGKMQKKRSGKRQ